MIIGATLLAQEWRGAYLAYFFGSQAGHRWVTSTRLGFSRVLLVGKDVSSARLRFNCLVGGLERGDSMLL